MGGFVNNSPSIAIQPDSVSGLWGWWDASDETKTAGSAPEQIGYIYDKRYGSTTGNYFVGTSVTASTINGVRSASFNGSNNYELLNATSVTAVTEPITTGVTASWNVFIVGQYSAAGTIISQNISATLSQRQMQIFRQASGSGIGGYLTTTVLRGVERSLNDNQDLNSDGFQPILIHFQINNSIILYPNVKTSGASNYVGFGVLPPASILEINPRISIGARTNGTAGVYTAYIIGKIGEIVMYNSNITSAERLGIKRYFAKKWGLIEATAP
jgi:hypothetical protein